jgi:hypothetical protein
MKTIFNKQQALANATICAARKWQNLDQQANDAFWKSTHAEYLGIAGECAKAAKKYDAVLNRLEKTEVATDSPYNLRVLKRAFEQASKAGTDNAVKSRVAGVALALIPKR